ncbi:MAG: replication protein, partial [Candidatus Binatia bacterium]
MSKKKPARQPREEFYYEGFIQPTTTPVPDDVFDVIAPELTEAELRVLLYIIRRTFGFKKNSDAISLSQMVKGIKTRDGRILDRGTGMSRRGVMNGCAGLVKKGIIIVTKRRSRKGDNEVNVYSLRFRGEDKRRVGNEVPYPGEPGSLPVGNDVPPQQTDIQQTVNTVNGNKSLLKDLPDLDQPEEKTEHVARYILDRLGDGHSEKFYDLVAAKVPEDIIRRALAEIKQDGAANPVKVFTHRMKLYALEQLKG